MTNSKPRGLSETRGFERMAERSSLTFTDMPLWNHGAQLDIIPAYLSEHAPGGVAKRIHQVLEEVRPEIAKTSALGGSLACLIGMRSIGLFKDFFRAESAQHEVRHIG